MWHVFTCLLLGGVSRPCNGCCAIDRTLCVLLLLLPNRYTAVLLHRCTAAGRVHLQPAEAAAGLGRQAHPLLAVQAARTQHGVQVRDLWQLQLLGQVRGGGAMHTHKRCLSAVQASLLLAEVVCSQARCPEVHSTTILGIWFVLRRAATQMYVCCWS